MSTDVSSILKGMGSKLKGSHLNSVLSMSVQTMKLKLSFNHLYREYLVKSTKIKISTYQSHDHNRQLYLHHNKRCLELNCEFSRSSYHQQLIRLWLWYQQQEQLHPKFPFKLVNLK